MIRHTIALLALVTMLSHELRAQDSTPWRIEAGATISHFQQQVKTDVGGETGERLVNEFQLGLGVSGAYDLVGGLSAGVFVRYDIGSRSAARFDGFDSSGRTMVRGEVGGGYSEVWLGPLLRYRWRVLSAEAGYAAIGIRGDDARDDLPSITGDTTGAFTTHPAIAWMIALGAAVPIIEHLDLLVRIEYRVRYYNRRGGNALIGEVDHGTQSIAPLIGVGWEF